MWTLSCKEMRWCTTWNAGSQTISSSFSLTVKSKSFKFHLQWTVAMKYASHSQMSCKLTVFVVFMSGRVSQHCASLIMRSKLLSLLIIRPCVTAELELKVNGICQRPSKENFSEDERKCRQKCEKRKKEKKDDNRHFYLISKLSHSEEKCCMRVL